MERNVECNFNMLIVHMKDWDGASPPFDELVRSALMQAMLLGRGERFMSTLTSKTEVGGTSFARYALGVSRPRPAMMRLIIREMREVLIATREQVTRDHNAMVMLGRHMGNCGPDD